MTDDQRPAVRQGPSGGTGGYGMNAITTKNMARRARGLAFPCVLMAASVWANAASGADCLAYFEAKADYEEAVAGIKATYHENAGGPLKEARARQSAEVRVAKKVREREWHEASKVVGDLEGKRKAREKFAAAADRAYQRYEKLAAELEPHGTAYKEAKKQAGTALEDKFIKIYAAGRDLSGYRRNSVLKTAVSELLKFCPEIKP